MMKKALFLAILLPLAMSSFAQDILNDYLFIEGTASRLGHYEFFLTNFRTEAAGAGYIVTDTKDEAAHTLKFAVTPSIITYDDRVGPQTSEPNEGEFLVRISLVSNADDFEILFFDFFFTELDEMYEHTRTLFQNATLYIPPSKGSVNIITNFDSGWKNKWIYFRASFDYPVTFYLLKGDGLVGGVALYNGDFETTTERSPINHEVIAMPGFTVGLEFQFLRFMSVEFNYQFSIGDTRSNSFFNMAFGVELKIPVKLEAIMIVPYAAFFYPIRLSGIFKEYPPFSLGAGIQFCAKGGKHGAFFFDVKYMISIKDAVMHNPYLAKPEDQRLYPEPDVIHYKHSFIGIGVGYKIGFLDRKQPQKDK